MRRRTGPAGMGVQRHEPAERPPVGTQHCRNCGVELTADASWWDHERATFVCSCGQADPATERFCSAGCGHPAWAHVAVTGCPRCACQLDWFDARVDRWPEDVP